MVKYSDSITVDRPAEDVFSFVADVTRHPSWMGGTEAIPLSDGAVKPGYRYRYSSEEGELEMEVTDFQPGRSFSARSLSGPFRWAGTFEVQPDGERRTTVRSSGLVGFSGIKRLLEPFMGGEVRKRERGELVRLKALAEGASAEADAVAAAG